MADCLLFKGGGGDADFITATAPDVLNGKIIVDKNGNPITGTMVNNAGKITTISDYNNANEALNVALKEGYYDTLITNGSKSYLILPDATLASLFGITPNKIKDGVKIMGVTGTAGKKNYIIQNGYFLPEFRSSTFSFKVATSATDWYPENAVHRTGNQETIFRGKIKVSPIEAIGASCGMEIKLSKGVPFYGLQYYIEYVNEEVKALDNRGREIPGERNDEYCNFYGFTDENWMAGRDIFNGMIPHTNKWGSRLEKLRSKINDPYHKPSDRMTYIRFCSGEQRWYHQKEFSYIDCQRGFGIKNLYYIEP